MTWLGGDLASLAAAQAWQVTALILAVLVATRRGTHQRPHLAYVLWLLVLIKCLTPPVWSAPSGLFCWMQTALAAVPETPVQLPADSGSRPVTVVAQGAAIPPPKAVGDDAIIAEADALHPAPNSPMGMSIDGVSASAGLGLRSTLVTLWLVGTGALVTVTSCRCWQFVRALRRAAIPHAAEYDQLVASLSRRLGLRGRARLWVTSSRCGPAVVGLFRPVIVLPELIVQGKRPAELEAIVAHELIHVRRGDLWFGLLHAAAKSLWWFHPLVWLAARLSTRVAERCCDEEVVGSLGCDPARYARSLLEILELKRTLQTVPAFPGMKPVDVTSQRLERIMQLRQGCRQRTPWWCWLVLVLGAAATLPGAAWVGAQEAPDAVAPAAPDATKSAEQPAQIQDSSDRSFRIVSESTPPPAWPHEVRDLLNALAPDNPGFELPREGTHLPGWNFAARHANSVQIDAHQCHSGNASLHLTSQGDEVWVRSNPLAVPKTGRLALWVWLKIDRPEEQPPLRLVIEGRLSDQPYLRVAVVGAGLKNIWEPYLFSISDLPTSGLTDLRVGFDLVGKGDIWIDDVKLVDQWFERAKRKDLGLSVGGDQVTEVAMAIRKESGGDQLAYAREYAAADIYPRVYNVADLVGVDGWSTAVTQEQRARKLALKTAALDKLVHRVRTEVMADTWDDSGGSGTIKAFPTNLCVVVSHTKKAHRAIHDYLNNLRKQQGLPPNPKQPQFRRPPPDAGAIQTHTYAVADLVILVPSFTASTAPQPVKADFKPLTDVITSTVATGSWSHEGGVGRITTVPTSLSLVIEQTASVHQQIAELLEQLRRLQDVQVTVETKFLGLPQRLFELIGRDFPGADGPAEDGSDFARQRWIRVRGEVAARLLSACQGDARAQILQSPKLTLFNSQVGRVAWQDQGAKITLQYQGVVAADGKSVQLTVLLGEAPPESSPPARCVRVPQGGALLLDATDELRPRADAKARDEDASIPFRIPNVSPLFLNPRQRKIDRIVLLITPKIVVASEEPSVVSSPRQHSGPPDVGP